MSRLVLWVTLPAAFVAGLLVARLAETANAAPAALKPQIIDVGAMTDADLGAMIPKLGTLRVKMLVATPQGSIAVQTGDVPKHMHVSSDEIQYIISGSGTFWLGDKLRHIHPGELIVIPKGTAHAGSHAIKGEFKAISIKLPPAVAGDYHPLK